MSWWWWLFVDRRRCFFTKMGSEIRVLRDLLWHRSCTRSFTGSLHRISATSSNGRSGSCGGEKQMKNEHMSDFRVLINLLSIRQENDKRWKVNVRVILGLDQSILKKRYFLSYITFLFHFFIHNGHNFNIIWT